MTVHDGVKAAEIGRAAAVHENRADCAAFLVPGVCQIIVVVRALHQRIGNLGARNSNPADDITVDLLQSRQIHLLQRLCIRVGRRSGFGFGLRFLRRRFGWLLNGFRLCHFGYRGNLGSLGVGFIACTVARHLAHQHECADGKHRCQKKQYHSPYLGLHTLTSFFAYYYSISDLSCKIGYIFPFDRKNYICQMR